MSDENNAELQISGFSSQSNHFTKPSSYTHEFYLSGPVLEASEYIGWFDKMRNCGQNDTVFIYINSGGGIMDTALQFMRVMADCPAHIICSVEGSCMSAATMIFLQGDELHVSENSLWMFHNYSGGSVGKGGEMYDNIIFEREWSSRLLHNVYEDFLTKEEIASMLNNKDIWMHGEEVIQRAQKAVDIRAEREKETESEEADE
jgi:ATP-dependent protease ClpP protease subunit